MIYWKIVGEANIVDMGNGFSLVKFTNAMDCNKVLEGQPWFVGGQSEKIFHSQKRQINLEIQ